MRLALPLHLNRFEQRLPPLPRVGPRLGERVTAEGRQREHPAVREITVVRDREDLAAGRLLPFGHPLPEVFGVLALERGVRQHLVGLVLVVAVDDVPMQVVAAAGVRRPLVADERREAPRFVVLLRDRGGLRPDGLGKRDPFTSGGSFLFACAATSSITAFFASTGPPLNMSRHLLSVGSAIISGLPPLISVIVPIMSE